MEDAAKGEGSVRGSKASNKSRGISKAVVTAVIN